jgi:Zn-dependent protease with chaperone function
MTVILIALLSAMSQDGEFFGWLALFTSRDVKGIQTAFVLGYITLHLLAAGSYILPFIEALRRGPRSITQAAPRSFSRRRIAVSITFPVLMQVCFGFVLWAAAVLMSARLHLPTLVATSLAALLGVFLAQYFFVWWVRRKSEGTLSRSHAALIETIQAFDQAGASIAEKSIYVLPTDRWPSPNAFVIGLGRKRCIVAVTQPLLEKLSPREVAAVLLHEYGHVWERHTVLLTLCLSVLTTWQFLFALRGREWLQSAGLSSPVSVNTIHELILCSGLLVALAIPFTFFSRWCERRADRFAVRFGRAADLASSLDKMSKATETPSEWPRWVSFLSTHPSFVDRINALNVQIPADR